jgi:hypothetical protein
VFETLSLWALCYGGMDEHLFLAELRKRMPGKGHVLASPARLHGCRVIAWQGRGQGFCVRQGATKGGPATAVFWMAGYVDGDRPRDWWLERGYGKDHVVVFDGRRSGPGGIPFGKPTIMDRLEVLQRQHPSLTFFVGTFPNPSGKGQNRTQILWYSDTELGAESDLEARLGEE